ncbi:MAG: DUF3866 family protein [bacterium]
MLKLRRGTVVEADPLAVEVGGERRRAWADPALVGPVEVGDEVIVNTEALDLGLGSGGFDIVHVNLSRGLDAEGADGVHVIKLNYSSLQHPVDPVERPTGGDEAERPGPVLVIPLHGHLAPAAWAAAQSSPRLRVGYVQTAGGALPGSLSRDVVELRQRELLCGHVTAGAAYGGEAEAITVIGALDAAAHSLGWDAIIAGPGPGILGSASRYGHGGMAALDTAHAALAAGLATLASPRLSSSDPRPRHRGLSHHTEAMLEVLLAPVRVPVPEVGVEGWPLLGEVAEPPAGYAEPRAALDDLIEVAGGRHDIAVQPVDLRGYAASGLPATTMGRSLVQDPLFFAAPLAAGAALAVAATRDPGA